jgi:hypothetical protein
MLFFQSFLTGIATSDEAHSSLGIPEYTITQLSNFFDLFSRDYRYVILVNILCLSLFQLLNQLVGFYQIQ